MKNNIFENLNGEGLKIGIVQARFNRKITDAMTKGAVQALEGVGVAGNDIKTFQVPGSFEVPLFCQRLAEMKKFDGIVSIGAIIRGETAHFDFIAKAATDGLVNVMLNKDIPITFGIITTNNLAQAEERSREDKKNKGYEAAMALVEVIQKLKEADE